MARITKVVKMDNRDSYAIVHVIVDGQEEAQVMIGGSVEVWFEPKYNRALAWVKRPLTKNSSSDTIGARGDDDAADAN